MSESRLFKGLVGLALVGVASAMLRYLLPFELHVAVTEPLFGSYSTDQLAVLRQHPVYEHAHRLGGSAWMILGLLQLVPSLRATRPVLHRWLGRTFVGLSVIVGLGGAAMGVLFPFEASERAPSLVFGLWMAFTGMRGMIHARRKEMAAHRAWMIRCFAVGLGISTIRLIAVALTMGTDIPTRVIVGPSFWAGWLVTVVAAEVWLRRPVLARAAMKAV